MKEFLKPVKEPGKIRSYFLREKGLVAALTFCGILFNGGLSTVLLLQGKMIDTVANGSAFSVVLHSALVYLVALLIVQSARYGKRYLVRRFANKTMAAMRLMVYNNIVSRDISQLKDQSMGELLTKAVGDVDISVEGIRKCTTEVFDTGVLMVSYFVSLIMLSPSVSLLSCISIPISILIAFFLKKKVVQANKEARETLGSATGEIYNIVDQAPLLRITGSEERRSTAYAKTLEKLKKKATISSILESSIEPLYCAIATMGMVLVLYLGSKQVLAGSWSIGSFSSYIFIFNAFCIKAGKVSKLLNAFQKATVSFARVKPFLTGYTKQDTTIHQPLNPEEGLVVKDVSFTYPTLDKPTLSHVSFSAHQGELIGVTGPVASGKSTLGIVLEGLYPYQGSIKLGGCELSTLTGFEKGIAISYQGHQSELLGASIKENILLGESGDVKTTLQETSLLEDIAQMDQKEETIVGTSGVRLSGGQAARVSLARALYRHTPLVILDDPFASVDHKTEEEIIQSIRSDHQNSIFIIISHRLSLFPHTDQVLFVQGDGSVLTGTHDSLLASSEAYRKLYALQMGGAS